MNGLSLIALGRRIANLYESMCAPLCRQYRINQTSFDILMFCANNPGRNTARDLCALRGIKSGIASVGVEALIRTGLLERQGDPHDRRIHRLFPAEKAAPIIAAGRNVQERFGMLLTAGILPQERAVFSHMLETVEHNLTLAGVEEGGTHL